jgi:DNA repair exonuclease SbcCD ATPase subunit
MKKIKKKQKPVKKVKTFSKNISLKKIKNKKSGVKVKKNKKKNKLKKNKKVNKLKKNKKVNKLKKNKKVNKLKKNKIIKKKFKLKKVKVKVKDKINNRISSKTKQVILSIIRLQDRLTPNFKFNFSLDRFLLSFFESISVTIDNFKSVLAEERERKKQLKIKLMESEKIETIKKNKLNKELEQKNKERELKEEATLERERKKELQKFIRIEQAQVRKEQAEKQRKFLEQIRLEKKIEQFRKREALEIKNLEKFVLNQERDSYAGVEERIEKIKQKYQALRDQKIRERVEQLGITVEEGEDRSALLEKERQYNLGRQKIEYALESYYRSAHSLCFQINKRYIPKYLNILRVIDRRFETGEIFIKWDDAPDEDWLILIYIKNNSPDEGIVIEDKSNSEKHASHEFKSNEIFKASDLMVDSLTNLLDRERKKRKAN